MARDTLGIFSPSLGMTQAGSGKVRVTFQKLEPHEPSMLLDEALRLQAAGGRVVQGVVIDAFIKEALGCQEPMACFYKGIPVSTSLEIAPDSMIVELTPAP